MLSPLCRGNNLAEDTEHIPNTVHRYPVAHRVQYNLLHQFIAQQANSLWISASLITVVRSCQILEQGKNFISVMQRATRAHESFSDTKNKSTRVAGKLNYLSWLCSIFCELGQVTKAFSNIQWCTEFSVWHITCILEKNSLPGHFTRTGQK